MCEEAEVRWSFLTESQSQLSGARWFLWCDIKNVCVQLVRVLGLYHKQMHCAFSSTMTEEAKHKDKSERVASETGFDCLIVTFLWASASLWLTVRFSPGQKTRTPVSMRSFPCHEPLEEKLYESLPSSLKHATLTSGVLKEKAPPHTGT